MFHLFSNFPGVRFLSDFFAKCSVIIVANIGRKIELQRIVNMVCTTGDYRVCNVHRPEFMENVVPELFPTSYQLAGDTYSV